MGKVILNMPAIEGIKSDRDLEVAFDRVGEQVADRARSLAPKLTGAGAASIAHEVVNEGGSISVRVSWSADQFHMLYQELGTSKMPANPFLRPSLDGTYSL